MLKIEVLIIICRLCIIFSLTKTVEQHSHLGTVYSPPVCKGLSISCDVLDL
jgi:hypothetical protein